MLQTKDRKLIEDRVKVLEVLLNHNSSEAFKLRSLFAGELQILKQIIDGPLTEEELLKRN